MIRVTGLFRALLALSGATLWACAAGGCGGPAENAGLREKASATVKSLIDCVLDRRQRTIKEFDTALRIIGESLKDN